VLIAVSESEGGNLTYVIKRTRIDRSTTSYLVGRMGRNGPAAEAQEPSGCACIRAEAHAGGPPAARQRQPVSRKIDDALLQALPQARREPFLQGLQAIVKGLEGERV
jgi:hypothetical protein